MAAHEEVWAEVTIARAASTLAGDLLGPLAVLRDHDAEHHSEHLRTLAAWLDHPGAPTAAARSIHVHPNTMRYRMARIADLAGLDLEDATVRLAVRLQIAARRGASIRFATKATPYRTRAPALRRRRGAQSSQ